MENRVTEQMMLSSDRFSAHRWWAYQWRILLSVLAYTLLGAARRLAPQGTELAEATVATLRNKRMKIGAIVDRKLSLVRLHPARTNP